MAEIGLGKPGLVDGSVDEGDVEFAVRCLAREIARRGMRQTKRDSGMCLAESSEDLGQINHAQGLDGTDVQLTTEHAANPGHRVTSLVDRSQRHASRCGQKGPASLSRPRLGDCLARRVRHRALVQAL